ncbi:hypothetical protein TSMEX_004844, partial [Taenia solium]
MPAQAPVMSKRIGDYQYERYDLSGGDSSPRRKEGPAPQQQGGDKKEGKSGQHRRRPQAGQGSDTDSGSEFDLLDLCIDKVMRPNSLPFFFSLSLSLSLSL